MKKRIYFYVMMFVLLGGAVTSSRAESFKVTLPKVTGATLTAIGLYDENSVNKGDAFKFTVKLDEGITDFPTVLVKAGNEVLTPCAVDTYVIPSVISDVAVTVAIDIDVYDVTLPSGDGYVATGEAKVVSGTDYSLVIKRLDGYTDAEYTVESTRCTEVKCISRTNTGDTWILSNVTGAPIITVKNLVKNSYVVSWTNPVGATFVVKDGVKDVENGSKVTYGTKLVINVKSDAGYTAKLIYANGKAIGYAGSTAACELVVYETYALTVDVELNTYLVMFTEPIGATLSVKAGEVDVKRNSKVAHGTELTVTAIAKEGYQVNGITANNVPIVDGKHTLVKSVTFRANVIAKPYVVTIGAVENGIISILKDDLSVVRSGDEVGHGSELTIRATPNNNYRLVDILVDGVAIAGKTVVVKKPITVSATFEEIKKCVITIEQVENGTVVVMNELEIVASGTSVDDKTELTIRATPATDCELVSIMVDGEPITGKNIIVTKSITISAKFDKLNGVESIDYSPFKIHSWGKNIYVNSDSQGVSDVSICDIGGRVIKQLAVGLGEMKIEMDKAGVYVVRVMGANYSKTEKVIVK